MGRHPVYLWTLPMFHCNGWCFLWSLSVVAGTHVCLRSVRAKAMYDAIADHRVTHLSGAPTVMSALIHAKPEERRAFFPQGRFHPRRRAAAGGCAARHGGGGFRPDTCLWLTETYGPATVNEWKSAWDGLDKSSHGTTTHSPGRALSRAEALAVPIR